MTPTRKSVPRCCEYGSYVYVQSEKPSADSDGLYTVGFYDPSGKWHPESDHADSEKAAKRVAYLNGTNVSFAE